MPEMCRAEQVNESGRRAHAPKKGMRKPIRDTAGSRTSLKIPPEPPEPFAEAECWYRLNKLQFRTSKFVCEERIVCCIFLSFAAIFSARKPDVKEILNWREYSIRNCEVIALG